MYLRHGTLMSKRSCSLLTAPGKQCCSHSKHSNTNANVAAPSSSFHKRVLPSTLVSLSSPRGKVLFREALALGGMESFFPLSEQFITQSEPALCSLSSLAMVLNALSFDPKKIWKGAWRWVSEDMLRCDAAHACGHSFEKIKSGGMDFNEFESLANCHGVQIQSNRAIQSSTKSYTEGLEKFRNDVKAISSSDLAKAFLIVNFSRKHIAQTGSGHFSPIGGYHSDKDLVLVMDTARFKYPPFWVPTEELWKSMSPVDTNTGQERGYFKIFSTSTKYSEVELQSCIKCDTKWSLSHHECCKMSC